MRFLIFIPNYLWWHYTQAIQELLSNIVTFLKFIAHFFSIRNLFFTLFAPWERMGESYKKGLDISLWAQTFVVNTVLRVLGFFIRGFTILFGICALISVSIFCIAIFLAWLLVPLIWLTMLFLVLETVI